MIESLPSMVAIARWSTAAWRGPRWQSQLRARQFSQNNRSLLTSRRSTRPEVPFLSQPIARHSPSAFVDLGRRLASTEARQLIKETAWRTVVYGTPVFAVMSIGWAIYFEYERQCEEFANPTPSEWSAPTRQAVRLAHTYENLYKTWRYVPWAYVAKAYAEAISRLEDPAIDGKDIVRQEDDNGGQIMIAGVGSVGFDITEKSWAWRESYFKAIMGLATASGQMESFVRDTSRDLIFPKSVVVGPSNPDPRPTTHRMEKAPLESDCEQAFDSPDVLYMKVLTTKGFNTQQKLQAALSYAGLLSSQRIDSAAEDMFRWAIDIAKAPLSNAAQLVDEKTFVLREPEDSSVGPSENLLQAVKAMAVHRARSGDTATALSIFLSILRARHEAPIATRPLKRPIPLNPTTVFEQYLHGVRWPDEDESLDQPYKRPIKSSDCEDSELMLYIGEIIYATSPKHEEGKLWTRRSLETGEKGIQALSEKKETNLLAFEEFMRCKQCLATGVKNWLSMLAVDLEQMRALKEATEAPPSWRSWLLKSQRITDEELVSKIEALETESEVADRVTDRLRGGTLDDSRYTALRAVPFGMFKG